MGNFERVNVLYSTNHLAKDISCLFFVYSFMFDDVIEELSFVCVFHGDIELFIVFHNLVELNDVFMFEAFENGDLSGDSFHICLGVNSTFFQYLNSNLFPCKMRGLNDPAKGALSQDPANDIILYWHNTLIFKNVK